MNRPPRTSVRRMMLAVAMVGVLMGGARSLQTLRARSAEFRRRAYTFSETGRECPLDCIWLFIKDGDVVFDSQDENYWLAREWAAEMAEKYWRLADRPWLTVEPDPPCPKLAHPRPAADCPPELRARGGPDREIGNRDCPWWTFPWT